MTYKGKVAFFIFGCRTVKEIMCKLNDLEVEELRTRNFWRKAERLRVHAKV